MVDTVILHTARDAARAGGVADALTERTSVLVSVAVGKPKPMFGAQMLVVGLVSGEVAANSDEAWLVEVVQTLPGRRLLVIDSAQAPAGLDPNLLVEPSDDVPAQAQLIRDAIARPDESLDKKKKKKQQQKLAKGGAAPPPMRTPPTPPRAPVATPVPSAVKAAAAPARAPVLSAGPQAEIVALDARRTALAEPAPPRAEAPLPVVEVFDPSKARRARKFGFAFGVGIGVLTVVTVLGFYMQVRRPAPAAVAPQTSAPTAVEAPVVTAPPETVPVEAPAVEEPVLRGRSDAVEPAAAPPTPAPAVTQSSPPAAAAAPVQQPPAPEPEAPAPEPTLPPALEPVPTE